MDTATIASLFLRDATETDVTTIREIYNHYVVHSSCTFDTTPVPPHGPGDWIAAHPPSHPAIVACAGPTVLGWATLSPYRTRCAYAHTVENSVYVRHDQHRRGIGRALLAELIRRAEQCGHHTIIAAIAADQPASLAIHEALGFERVGCLREVGYKFDRWIDVVFLQRLLARPL